MKTHEFDPISFFLGVIITAIGVIFLLPNGTVEIAATFRDLGAWLWPTVFIAIGLAVLVPGLSPRRRTDGSSGPDPQGAVEAPDRNEEE
ncbi:MAG: LiaI-LiaF-like domain-containing protein [Acidimicrobiia bacterium]